MALNYSHLDHVVLRVTDIDRSLDFYCNRLGMTLVKQVTAGLYHLQAGNSMIDLVPVGSRMDDGNTSAPQMSSRNVDHFCLLLDPFDGDAITALLDQHGIDHSDIKTRFGAGGDGPAIYLTDPDGNGIELKGPAAP